ncbi:MAG: GNAT family protein [Myxococcota bacterium]
MPRNGKDALDAPVPYECRGADTPVEPRRKEAVEVVLRPGTVDELDALSALMQPRDIWGNLRFKRPPTPFVLRLLWRSGLQVLFIHRSDDERLVGFFLVYGPDDPLAAREFDGAILHVGDRRLGLAQKSVHAFQDRMFSARRCAALVASINAENVPSQQLLRSCGFRVTPGEPEDVGLVRGVVQTYDAQMNRVDWERLRAQQAHRRATLGQSAHRR